MISLPSVFRIPLSIRPLVHSLALVPSKRTIAPCGGLAQMVGLRRLVFSKTKLRPSSVWPRRTFPTIVADAFCCPGGGKTDVAENSFGDCARYFRLPVVGLNVT